MGGDPTATSFSWGLDSGVTVDLIYGILGSSGAAGVQLVVAAGNGSPALDILETRAIRQVFGSERAVDVLAPKNNFGEFDGNALLRLAYAFSHLQGNSFETKGGTLLLLGASTGGSRAALTFDLSGAVPGAE